MPILRTDPKGKWRYACRWVLFFAVCLGAGVVMTQVPVRSVVFWIAGVSAVASLMALTALGRGARSNYRCPSCGEVIPNPETPPEIPDTTMRFYCPKYHTVWDTGIPHPDMSSR